MTTQTHFDPTHTIATPSSVAPSTTAPTAAPASPLTGAPASAPFAAPGSAAPFTAPGGATPSSAGSVPPQTRSVGQPVSGYAGPVSTRNWLVQQRNDGVTPDKISAQLLTNGWDSDAASAAAMSSLRSADYHRLMYSTLCWGAGLSALGAGTAAHVALSLSKYGEYDNGPRIIIATMLALLIVALPLTIVALFKSREVERNDPFAVWSPTRRFLFGLLGGCVGVVGVYRALAYLYELIAAGVGVEGYHASAGSVLQVLVTLAIAVPIVWWSVIEWTRSNVARRSLRASGAADTLKP